MKSLEHSRPSLTAPAIAHADPELQAQCCLWHLGAPLQDLLQLLSALPLCCPPSQPVWPLHLVTVQYSQVDFHGCLVFPQG